MAKIPPSKTRRPGKAKVRPKRDTLVSLRQHVDDIAQRLGKADQLTQQSVKALQIAFTVLEKRASEDASVNHAALTRRIDQISGRLTGLIEETHKGVTQDLKGAIDNPTLGGLKAAVIAAEDRMASAEIMQASALTKVNQHIAMLAKAIDARFKAEIVDREKSVTELKTEIDRASVKTDTRIVGVEQSSTKAIIMLGERVVSISEDFKKKTESNTLAISEKISEIALKTQSDFDAYKKRVERRIENLEDNQRNLDSYADRSLETLTARIDSLEYGLTTVPPLASNAQHEPLKAPYPTLSEPPKPAETSLLVEDAFTPPPSARVAPVAPPILTLVPETVVSPSPSPPRAYAPEPTPVTPQPAPTNSSLQTYMPRPYPSRGGMAAPAHEFVPTEFVPETYTPVEPSSYTPSAYQPSAVEPLAPQSPSAVPAYPAAYDPQAQSLPQDLALQPLDAQSGPQAGATDFGPDDLPYFDPAYAESAPEASVQRPGVFARAGSVPRPSFKLPPLNLKVAGLAVTVAALGYYGYRSFTAPSNQAPNGDRSAENVLFDEAPGSAPIPPMNNPGLAAPQSGGLTPEQTQETIGQYQDNQGLNTAGQTASVQSLAAAAEGGDPAAEFQLGVSYLQSGKTDEGVKLIRASANQGQPAAQYRLAKLYESGEGVEADPVMARQLTERAARSGNRIAMHDLALYYAEGRGDVEVNIETAAQWFEKAAQRGVVDSQFNLGVLFESGQGLPKNLTDAYVWYSIAAEQGDQFARERIDILKDQLAKADLGRADKRISSFKPTPIDEEANGIFKNVSWTVPSDNLVIRKVDQIRETQALLGQLGYETGTPDGAMGPRTHSAIISFQEENGLAATGEVDTALIVALQRAAGA